MRNSFLVLILLFIVAAAGGGCATTYPKGPAEVVAEGCKTELETYCKDVTPGEMRVLACLYAFNDKLSNRCEYALYDAASQLQHAVDALAYVAAECRDDLKANCSDVTPGEGRLLQCLDKNKEKVSDRCKQAQKDVGLK
jgi:hypothetical protein